MFGVWDENKNRINQRKTWRFLRVGSAGVRRSKQRLLRGASRRWPGTLAYNWLGRRHHYSVSGTWNRGRKWRRKGPHHLREKSDSLRVRFLRRPSVIVSARS